ncbi:hypothetical protein J6590_085251 [Homalodisca vitripennis]|nr:hypothetical protein J6590_085251 [Homalodisca vitripennis]
MEPVPSLSPSSWSSCPESTALAPCSDKGGLLDTSVVLDSRHHHPAAALSVFNEEVQGNLQIDGAEKEDTGLSSSNSLVIGTENFLWGLKKVKGFRSDLREHLTAQRTEALRRVKTLHRICNTC